MGKVVYHLDPVHHFASFISFLLSFICNIKDKLVKKDAIAVRIKISRPIEERSKANRNTLLEPKTIMLATNETVIKSH